MAKSSHREGTAGARGRGLLTPGRITAAVLGVLGLVFIFENTRATKIRLLIPEVTMPLWLALMAMGLIGVIVGWSLRSRR